MDNKIRDRILTAANIFVTEKSTVREVAKKVGCSKSTVHKDFIERLEEIDKDIYEKVKELLEYNKTIRHIRGGEATKNKFLYQKNL